MPKTIAIIQARIGSQRLPGKVLKTLGNTIVLDYVVTRSKAIMGVDKVIVATSNLRKDDKIVEWCCDNKIEYFRGSEENVLSRYYYCALKYQPKYIIRITGDCPFVDYNFASETLKEVYNQKPDIIKITGKITRGLTVEILSFESLEFIYQKANLPRHFEHVTYYATEHPEKFDLLKIKAPKYMLHPEFRITLDTDKDYQVCSKIAEHFNGDIKIETSKIISFLVRNPEVANINKYVMQKPVV